ncbi:hypothetical protein DACRYDRAFT_22975 [Dacryopinax primogenitus]|uniref:Uncharacterized protein n=1 Tax=Dacryopinax primogenitus (strain DJM 731) TaxID=1858805 RepID=M5G9M4_DACPD|nr:uncharacterized protein DACRYDRAFT_22975 [Dacryopinax primogenitus]EJU00518.1 hypothetical protein DACRYDRAFT_22975 [Dacryopinax primogenitus]
MVHTSRALFLVAFTINYYSDFFHLSSLDNHGPLHSGSQEILLLGHENTRDSGFLQQLPLSSSVRNLLMRATFLEPVAHAHAEPSVVHHPRPT